uniref:Pept_C1 domain-containing protein n=1 Tax=Trichuris muris TaxID=70415 RepID=A0A5S6QAW7_TRIMR
MIRRITYPIILLTSTLLSATRGGEYETTYAELTQGNDTPATWKMGLNSVFKSMSMEQIASFLGDLTTLGNENNEQAFTNTSLNTIDLPPNFDARIQWPYCKYIGMIRNQANCGSCWAVSSASVITDRHCIASDGFEQPYISDEQLLSCCQSCGYGCHGGDPREAFRFWVEKGLVTGGPYGDQKSCMPYEIKPCTKCNGTARTPPCRNKCVEGYLIDKEDDTFYGKFFSQLPVNESLIRQEIHLRGPVKASFAVYSDFLYYQSGIYKQTKGAMIGGHAVKIIGWGEENGMPYWLIANSWGTTFGEHGLFRIKRGSNECGIESRVIAGIAKRRLPDVRAQT